MFRLLAAALILYGSAGFSFKLCQEMRTRIRHIGQLQELFRLMQSEISYNRAAFPEICLQVSKRTEQPYQAAMEEIYRKAYENCGTPIPVIWREVMERCMAPLPLKKEEREIILEFGGRLGFTDMEMQIGMLDKSRTQLERLYEQAKNAMENKEKVITGVGILGGLMLVIILI